MKQILLLVAVYALIINQSNRQSSKKDKNVNANARELTPREANTRGLTRANVNRVDLTKMNAGAAIISPSTISIRPRGVRTTL